MSNNNIKPWLSFVKKHESSIDDAYSYRDKLSILGDMWKNTKSNLVLINVWYLNDIHNKLTEEKQKNQELQQTIRLLQGQIELLEAYKISPSCLSNCEDDFDTQSFQSDHVSIQYQSTT